MSISTTEETIEADNIAHLNSAVIQDELVNDVEIRFGYSIGYFRFVLDKTVITEIVVNPSISRIPNSPEWIHGMINLRGNILPVIDISNLLNAKLSNPAGQYVLVVDKGKESLALIIDALPKSLPEPVSESDLDEISNLPAQFLSPGVRSESHHWVELDIKSLALGMKDEYA